MRLAGRNPRELAFRLQQALANLRIWAVPPSVSKEFFPADLDLPKPERIREQLKNSPFRDKLVSLADEIVQHRLPMLGRTVDTGPHIQWRRDYIHDKTSDTRYFRFIPYLNFEEVGDHKNIWELNRHQHLVVLAQAFVLTGNGAYRDEIAAELHSWWEQNPFLKGINWTSALEVAFRALSWLWIDHLAGASLDERLRDRLLNSLHQHGAFLESNLSTYFSPNTHLLGEGVALHAIGLKLRHERWRMEGARVVGEELVRQVAKDGSHFEQSTYYHLYAVDFFLLHYVLAGRPKTYPPVLKKMARFLAAIAGPERLLTCFGDDDGGRLFHPYGPRDLFPRATLATCAQLFPEEGLPFATDDLAEQAEWWMGCEGTLPVANRGATVHFPDSGLVSISRGPAHILVDTGRFGFGGAGHSHADTLSVTARVGERELLIDPGTFTYIADARLRDQFRGTGFHNTIRIDGVDQADPAGPFRWANKPDVRVDAWNSTDCCTHLDATCTYRGFSHRRRVLCVEDEWLFILDEVAGLPGEHLIEQFWHLGDRDVRILLTSPEVAKQEEGLRSKVLGQKEAAPVIRSSWKTALPHVCGAALSLRSQDGILERNNLSLTIRGVISVSFTDSGMPVVTRS
jgi:hypothetical protein